jgi:hypothetical protein
MAEDGRMGEGWRKHGMRHGGMMGPAAMRIIFALMDRDSDGTVSLEEFQAAHERIFKAMDTGIPTGPSHRASAALKLTHCYASGPQHYGAKQLPK